MIDLQVRIARELERGPLRREILAKRFRTVSGGEFNDALLALQSAGSIALKGLRFHQVSGAAIEHDQPAPATAAAHNQGGNLETERACKRCGAKKPIDAFAVNQECTGGRDPTCKECRKKGRSASPSMQTSAKTGGGKPMRRGKHAAKWKKAKPQAARHRAVTPATISEDLIPAEIADQLTALLGKLFAIAEKVTIAKVRDLLDRQYRL